MNHFVQYHKRGDLNPEEPANIETNKSVRMVAKGDRVWLIRGDGEPRRYALAVTFIVDRVVLTGEGNQVWGSGEKWFERAVPIDKEAAWFQSLLETSANFSLGFLKVANPEILNGLAGLCPEFLTAHL